MALLPNGQNSHINIKTSEWWQIKLIKLAEEFKELKILALCDERGKDNDVKWVSIDIRDQIKKYINHFLLHGSLSTLDYIKGWSDLDTWVIIDDEVFKLESNKSIFIPSKSKLSLANKYDSDLILIEVWYGDKLSEEDIIRYEDIYGRV